MSCARNLGLTSLPIVCVSVEGFYDNFDAMLKRAYEEGLVKNKPEDGKQNNALGLGSQVPMDLIFFIFLLFFFFEVVHFVPTAEDAVRWIELRKENASSSDSLPKVKVRDSILRRTSFFNPPTTFLRSMSWFSEDGEETWFSKLAPSNWIPIAASFAAGLLVGGVASRSILKR